MEKDENQIGIISFYIYPKVTYLLVFYYKRFDRQILIERAQKKAIHFLLFYNIKDGVIKNKQETKYTCICVMAFNTFKYYNTSYSRIFTAK